MPYASMFHGLQQKGMQCTVCRLTNVFTHTHTNTQTYLKQTHTRTVCRHTNVFTHTHTHTHRHTHTNTHTLAYKKDTFPMTPQNIFFCSVRSANKNILISVRNHAYVITRLFVLSLPLLWHVHVESVKVLYVGHV